MTDGAAKYLKPIPHNAHCMRCGWRRATFELMIAADTWRATIGFVCLRCGKAAVGEEENPAAIRASREDDR